MALGATAADFGRHLGPWGCAEPRICTSHVERSNWTLRGHLRRMTRLSNGFSRKRSNQRAALALYFAYYNFCKFHKSIRMTPAMAAGIARKPWSLADLLSAAQGAVPARPATAGSAGGGA